MKDNKKALIVDSSLHEEFKKYCVKHGLKMRTETNKMVDDYINKNRVEKLR